MDQLCPSLYGVVPALCDRMDCAHQARVVPCSALRRAVCMCRYCLQRLRTPSIGPRGRHAGVRACTAFSKAPITHCPCGLYNRYAGCVRRAAPRLRSDLRRPAPPLASRGSRLHKSMTTSPICCEQQTRTLPSASFFSKSDRRPLTAVPWMRVYIPCHNVMRRRKYKIGALAAAEGAAAIRAFLTP